MDVAQMMGGKSLEEIMREKMEQDPLEKMLKGDVSAVVEAAAKQLSPDRVSLSDAGLSLAETTAAKDYLALGKEARQAEAEMQLADAANRGSLVEFMSADMRNSIAEMEQKGAQGKMAEEVRKSSEENVKELKRDIDEAAARAAAPKGDDGEPLVEVGSSSAAPVDAAPAAAAPVASAQPVVELTDSAPAAPKAAAVAKVDVTI